MSSTEGEAPLCAARKALIARGQQLLEGLYGLAEGPCATQFLVTDRSRLERLAPGLRSTDEHVLVRQDGEELELLLFLDDGLLERLVQATPAFESGGAAPVDAAGAGDTLVLLEGLSHFRYIVDRAEEGRSTCLLELEIQAEVDKFFALCLALDPSRPRTVTGPLWQLQFARARFHQDLDTRESAMYREANRLAARFCARLLRLHAGRGLTRLVDELRAFRRLGGRPKLAAVSG